MGSLICYIMKKHGTFKYEHIAGYMMIGVILDILVLLVIKNMVGK